MTVGPRPKPSAWVLAALLAAAVLAVYLPLAGAGFVAVDDDLYVTGNPFVREGLTVAGVRWAFSAPRLSNYHPLALLSHMLDVELFGMRAGAHHLVSLALHLAATLLLFLFLLAATGAQLPSAAVAALFAVHPMHVESVAWIAERKDVLCGFFWMLALLAHVRLARRPGAAPRAALLLAFAAGLLSKAMIVTLPVLLLLLDFWPLGRIGPHGGRGALRALVREKIPLVALSALFGALALAAQAGSSAMPSFERYHAAVRVQKAVLGYGEYLRQALAPLDLAVFYPQPLQQPPPWQLLGWGLLLAGFTGGALLAWRRAPWLPVGWLWFAVTLLPVSGLLQAGSQFIADRYTYVPYVGLFLAAGFGTAALARGPRAPRAVAVGALALLACLAGAARAQVGYWRDSAALFGRALAVTRENWMAHAGLGADLLQRGERAAARAHFAAALRIHPEDATAHFNAGVLEESEGRLEEAARHYRRALELDGAAPEPALGLAGLAVRQGDPARAETLLRAALAGNPGSAELHARLGAVLAAGGRLREAIVHFERAVAAVPVDPASRFSLAAALEAAGDLERAIREYRAALARRPGDAAIHNNLGVALAKTGLHGEALAHFREALRLDPGLPGARENHERAAALAGR